MPYRLQFAVEPAFMNLVFTDQEWRSLIHFGRQSFNSSPRKWGILEGKAALSNESVM